MTTLELWHPYRSFLRNRLVFYGEALRTQHEIGAIAVTSRAVARCVAAPIVRGDKALRVLEVGAGTGALTVAILARLGDGDRLDIYEINAAFSSLLRARFSGRRGPQVGIFEG